MSRFSVIVLFCLLWQRAQAQLQLPESFREAVQRAQNVHASTSASRQFTIHDDPADGLRSMALTPSLASNYARIDGALLAVSCERIKSAVLTDFGLPDQWQGTVTILLHQTRRLDEDIVVGSTVNDGQWSYYMNLPDIIQRDRLISALTGMVLLEMANRGAARSAEIPAWLVQGFARQISRESMDGLIVREPNHGPQDLRTFTGYFDGTKTPALELARLSLLTYAPLSIDDLSWPRGGDEMNDSYQSSAQLLLCRLFMFNDGRQCLRKMLQELPQFLNWQIAFLDAFNSHFSNQRDFEKWWDLGLVTFTGRDISQTWSHADSWRKLDEIIRTGAQIRTSADVLPMHTEVTLQSVVGDWGYLDQAGVLQDKLRRLTLLRGSASQDMIALIDDYRLVLDDYLKARNKSGAFRSTTAARVLGPDTVALQTIQQLNALDAERESMRDQQFTAGETASNAQANH